MTETEVTVTVTSKDGDIQVHKDAWVGTGPWDQKERFTVLKVYPGGYYEAKREPHYGTAKSGIKSIMRSLTASQMQGHISHHEMLLLWYGSEESIPEVYKDITASRVQDSVYPEL